MKENQIKEAFGDTSALKSSPQKAEDIKKLVEELKAMAATDKGSYATVDSWRVTEDDMRARRITANPLTGHQHAHSIGQLVGGSTLVSPSVHSYSSATISTTHYERMRLTPDGRIEMFNAKGDKIMEFNTELGTIKFLEDFNMDEAGRIFWEAIMKSGSSAVSRMEYDRIAHENAKLHDELRRTKELLNKSLKELAKEYTKGDEA